MKRLILLLILCTALGAGARGPLGVRAGVSVNIPGHVRFDDHSASVYHAGFGAALGAVYDVRLGHGFFLRPELLVSYDSYSYRSYGTAPEYRPGINGNPSLWKVGLRVPLMLGLRVQATERLCVEFYTGPELNYYFAGKFSNPQLSLFKEQRHTVGFWKIGVAFPLGAWLLSLDAAYGFTNTYTSHSCTMHENRVTLGAAYYF